MAKCLRCGIHEAGPHTCIVHPEFLPARLEVALAEVERLTAENKRLTTLAANNSAWRAARDQARDDAKRLRAELAKTQHAVSGCCPQSEALARDVERLSEDRDDWLIKAERLRGAVEEARWQLERAEPQSDMSRVECTSWHDRNLRWLAEHGKEAGDG